MFFSVYFYENASIMYLDILSDFMSLTWPEYLGEIFIKHQKILILWYDEYNTNLLFKK